jgi:hypothetical protein
MWRIEEVNLGLFIFLIKKNFKIIKLSQVGFKKRGR